MMETRMETRINIFCFSINLLVFFQEYRSLFGYVTLHI